MPKLTNWSRVDETELDELTQKSKDWVKNDDIREKGKHLEYKKGWSNDRFPFVKAYIYKTHKYEEYDITFRIFGQKAGKISENLHGFDTFKEAKDKAHKYLKFHGGEYNQLKQVHLPDEFKLSNHEQYKFEHLSDRKLRKSINGYNYDPTIRGENHQLVAKQAKRTLEDFFTLYYGIRGQLKLYTSVGKDELENYREWRGEKHNEASLDDSVKILRSYIRFFSPTQGSRYSSYEVASTNLEKIKYLAENNMEDE